MAKPRPSWGTLPFDVLIFVLVLAPLLTGGVWYRSAGVNVELAELGIPVLIAAVCTLVLQRGIDPSRSAVIRLLTDAWNFWRKQDWRGVASGSLAMGAILSLASLRRHWALGSNAADLGIFQGALWNFVHGHGLMSPVKGGILLFRDHLSPILLVLSPLFTLLPRPETLLSIQGFGLALGAIPLYFLARQHTPPRSWIPIACPLLYWLYLPTRNGNAYDFHPETLMLPIGLSFIACAQSARLALRWFAIPAGILLIMGKESSGAVLTGLGAAWALGAAPEVSRRFCRRLGAVLIPFGIILFWLETVWIPRHFFDQTYVYNVAYAGFSPGFVGILKAPFEHPLLLIERILGPARLKFLFWTLGGLAFLPLLHWRAAIAAVPCYLMLFLTSGDHRLNLYFYYATEASISLFWALPAGWALAAGRAKDIRRYGYTGATLLVTWVLFWSLGLSGRSEAYRIRNFSPTPHTTWLRDELVPCVEPGVSLAATGSLLPQLAQRDWAVALPMIQGAGGQPYSDCVIEDSSIDIYPMTPATRQELLSRLNSLGFQPQFQCGTLQVLGQKSRCLRCTPPCR